MIPFAVALFAFQTVITTTSMAGIYIKDVAVPETTKMYEEHKELKEYVKENYRPSCYLTKYSSKKHETKKDRHRREAEESYNNYQKFLRNQNKQ